MSLLHSIWLYLWVAPHLLLVVVAALMFRRELHKDFPVFFTYLLFEFLQFSLLFAIYTLRVSIPMYVTIDMFGRAGSIALRFAIFREMFEAPVVPVLPWSRAMTQILNWVTTVLVVLASLFVGFLYFSMHGHTAVQPYVVVQGLNTAQCGLLVLLFLWHRFLGLRMLPFVFGIAVGIGLAAGLEPFITALKDFLPRQSSQTADLLHMAVYHVAVLVWLYFALAREKVNSDAGVALLQLRERAAELGRIVHL